VVVDVPLSFVLLALILVGLVGVLHGGVVVLMVVAGIEVAPILAVGEVVDHVVMRVGVNRVLVPVLVGHGSSLCPGLLFFVPLAAPATPW
jgi:hypothetical protein